MNHFKKKKKALYATLGVAIQKILGIISPGPNQAQNGSDAAQTEAPRPSPISWIVSLSDKFMLGYLCFNFLSLIIVTLELLLTKLTIPF